jgi:hypothetical protein
VLARCRGALSGMDRVDPRQFPELALVVATNGGSYGSRGWRYAGDVLIPAIPAAVRR